MTFAPKKAKPPVNQCKLCYHFEQSFDVTSGQDVLHCSLGVANGRVVCTHDPLLPDRFKPKDAPAPKLGLANNLPPEWYRRLVEEEAMLQEKFEKLDKFIRNEEPLWRDPINRRVNEQDLILLRKQSAIMYEYLHVLGERMRNYNPDA